MVVSFTERLSAHYRHVDTLTAEPSYDHKSSKPLTPAEQLEQLEQQITLTLQDIDANFDACQRCLRRNVLPTTEKLASLSNELLSTAQPWLQFFMAVASAGESTTTTTTTTTSSANIKPVPELLGQLPAHQINDSSSDDGDGQTAASSGQAQSRRVSSNQYSHEPAVSSTKSDSDSDDSNWDTDIQSPHLTSHFMTTEIRTTSRPIPTTTAPPTSSYSVRSSASILASPARPPPTFASIKGVAYSMAPPSGGPRRRTLATSLIASGSTPKVKHFPQSPAGLMRSVLTIQHRQASATSHEQRPTTSPAPNAKAASSPLQISSFHQGPALSLPGSAASRMSKATSSVGTEDLMMDSSPLHTVTMAFPKSHKKSQLTLPSTHRGQVYPNSGGDSGPRNINSTSHHSGNDDNANDNDDDDVDDILSEVDSLINRYQSPGAKGNIAVSRMGVSRVSDSALSRRSHVSQSSSQGPGEKEIEEMTALVGKYISPEHHRYYLGGHVPAAASASKSKNNGAPHVTNGLKNRLVSEMDEVIGKGSSIVNADPGDSLAFSAKPNDGSGGDDSDIDLDTEIEPPALTVSLESLNRPRSIKRLPTEQQQQQQPQHQLLVAAVSKGGNVDGGSGNSGNSVSGAARSASNVLIERPQKRHQHRGGDETICMDVEDMDDVTISRQSPLAMQAHRAQARQEAVLRQQIKSSSAGGQRQAQRPAQNRTSTATNLRSAGGQSQITPHFASAGLYDPNDDPFFPPQASSVSSSHARLETTSRNADSSAITADTSQITSDQAPTNPRWQRHGYLIDEDESMDLNPASIAKNDNIPPTSVSANSFSGSDGRR